MRWPVATWNGRNLCLLHQYDNFFIAAVLGIQIQQHVNDLISSNESVGQLFRMLFIAVSIDEDVRLLSLIGQSKLQILTNVVFPIYGSPQVAAVVDNTLVVADNPVGVHDNLRWKNFR